MSTPFTPSFSPKGTFQFPETPQNDKTPKGSGILPELRKQIQDCQNNRKLRDQSQGGGITEKVFPKIFIQIPFKSLNKKTQQKTATEEIRATARSQEVARV